jgi:hypothetical protein
MESDALVGKENGHAETAYSTYQAGLNSPKFTQKTVFGEVRNWKRFSWLEWLFVAVALISTLGILGVSIQRLVAFKHDFENITLVVNESRTYTCNNWTCTNDFIFTVVLVLNIIFSAWYAVDGLLRERMFDLVGYAVTIAVIMIYVIANYASRHREKQELRSPIRIVRLILVLIGGPINIALACMVSHRMGYFIFTTVGSNTALIRAYKIRSFCLTLQCLLLQVMANLLALSWSRDGLFVPTAEKVIVSLLLVNCVTVILLGWSAVFFEKHWLVPVWYILLAPYFAYFVYKLVNVSVNFEGDYETKVYLYEPKKHRTNFKYIGVVSIVACILGLVVLALLYLFMALNLRNFKKGLKDKVPPPTDVWQGLCHSLAGKLRHKSGTSPRA